VFGGGPWKGDFLYHVGAGKSSRAKRGAKGGVLKGWLTSGWGLGILLGQGGDGAASEGGFFGGLPLSFSRVAGWLRWKLGMSLIWEMTGWW
jgi:hypothetical protein